MYKQKKALKNIKKNKLKINTVFLYKTMYIINVLFIK